MIVSVHYLSCPAVVCAGRRVRGGGRRLARFPKRPDEPRPDDFGSLLFRECATEVGIDWRMRFLPNEQGATFKINLYDHGCRPGGR